MPGISQTIHLIHNFSSELKKKKTQILGMSFWKLEKQVGRKKMVPNKLQYSQLPCFSYNA